MDNINEVCENCIWWAGDNSAMQGQCEEGIEDDSSLTTGRHDSCEKYLARFIGTDEVGML
tara:strand:+ start:2379 stop:2558 length:180 start_codon:yes stop_codon:yes gene_type:complete